MSARPPKAKTARRAGRRCCRTAFRSWSWAARPWSLRERRGGFVDKVGFPGQDVRDALDLFVGFLPALLLDRLAHAGDGLDSVAGVKARRINHVPVPGSS